MNKYLSFTLIALLLLAMAFGGGVLTHRAWTRAYQSPPDTVTVFRTQYIASPTPAEVRSAPPSTPSVTIRKRDLQPSPEDSATVQVRPEVKTYQDSLPSGLAYKIQISGVGAAVQTMDFSWPQKEILKPTPFKGWAVDLVGKGTITGLTLPDMTGLVSLELGYHSDRFSFGLGPGVMWSRQPGAASHSAALCVTGTARIRLATIR